MGKGTCAVWAEQCSIHLLKLISRKLPPDFFGIGIRKIGLTARDIYPEFFLELFAFHSSDFRLAPLFFLLQPLFLFFLAPLFFGSPSFFAGQPSGFFHEVSLSELRVKPSVGMDLDEVDG